MPEGVISEVRDGFATIEFTDPALKGPALSRLLAAGGPASIQTLTREGSHRRYRVPEGNAAEAGLLDSPGTHARGDSGFSEDLAAVGNEGARPTQPTSSNAFVGETPFTESQDVEHVETTTVKRGPGRPRKTPEPPPQ